MKRSTSRWITGISVGAMIHAGIFWLVGWVSETHEGIRVRSEKNASLRFVGADAVERSPIMRQQIVLFDPKPLLLPTSWNAANLGRTEAYQEEDMDLFPDYAPVFGSEDGDFVQMYGNPWREAGSAKEAQLGFPLATTQAFGRAASERMGEALEGVGVEVVDVLTGNAVFAQDYNNNVALEISDSGELWAMASFMVQIVDSFQIGSPVIAVSSGSPEIDRRLSDLLMRDLIPKGLLRNGSYLVRVAR